jgi:amino acid transporter
VAAGRAPPARPEEEALSHRATPGAGTKTAVLRKVTLLQLVAATYFMVAGGPYGLEDLVKNVGYGMAGLVLLLTPLVWSLPTGLMVGELSSAIPEEGGYYAWVRRALGPFWGFQEAWLSLAASVFDMALYPTLVVTYLGSLCRLLHWADPTDGPGRWAIGLGVIAVCVLANLRGARTVGGSSVLFTVALLGPFVVLVVLALVRGQPPAAAESPPGAGAFLPGVLVALWNYMGWDNASTIAGEVDRPQRTYPLAMLAAVALVTVTYVVPVVASARSGVNAADWETGSWVHVGGTVGGTGLAVAIAVGGMIGGLGTFNSLVMSYTRIPVVLAADGYLPAAFRRCHPRTGAPWVSILACAAGWALALRLSLPRLLALDVILYGMSLLLEFAALFALRVREPRLLRPFKVPGGLPVAALLGVGPAVLIAAAIYDQAGRWTIEKDDPMSPARALILGVVLAGLGPVIYWISRRLARPRA